MEAPLYELHARHERSHWWFVARRSIVSALLKKLVPAVPPPLVIDVGCGTGGNLGELASWCRCVGIDTSPRAIELASERYPKVQFIRGLAPADLGALAGQADVFLLMDVLEHVEGDREMLSSLIGASREGALFLITVPADMSLWSEHDVQNHHFRRYSKEQLEALWDGLPVETLLVSYFNARLYPAIRAARSVGRLLKRGWGESKSDLGTPPPFVNGVLTRLFGGEQARLLAALAGRRRPYARGVSLITAIRRTADVGAPAHV